MSEPAVVTPAMIRFILVPDQSCHTDWIAQRLSMALYEKVRTVMVHDRKAIVTLVVSTRGILRSPDEKNLIAEFFKRAGWPDAIVQVTPASSRLEEDEISLVVQSKPIEEQLSSCVG